MCGRFALAATAEELRDLFDLARDVDGRLAEPRYNIAPTQPILVVRNAPRGREALAMRWGLIPSWVKDPKDFPLLINARSETAPEKNSFRAAFRHRRCLVPTSGFYEWQKRAGGPKQPHWIAPADGSPTAFAGLWETWSGPNGEELDTAAILTCTANRTLAPIHDRMPVTLMPDHFDTWLAGETPVGEAHALCRATGDNYFAATPVSTRVNSVANDGAELQEPLNPA